jgi:hypothetical protein
MDENKDIKSTSLGYLEERELGNILVITLINLI